MARVIAVVGGSGGVGASTFAAVLASVAAASGPALLLDLDVAGGGLDVVLGIEDAPGARWSGLRLAGGDLDAQVLLDGLPAWHACSVLAADVAELAPAAVSQVLDALDLALDTVVVDLPRGPCPQRDAALARCDLVVVLIRADAPGLVAAHAQLRILPELPTGLLVRRGDLGGAQAAGLVGAPLLGELPALRAGARRRAAGELPRVVQSVAEGVLDGLVLESVRG